MPVTGLKQEFQLQTRNVHTTVLCEVGLRVDGRELPNMEVLGGAVEAAIQVIRDHVTKSYQVVPERV